MSTTNTLPVSGVWRRQLRRICKHRSSPQIVQDCRKEIRVGTSRIIVEEITSDEIASILKPAVSKSPDRAQLGCGQVEAGATNTRVPFRNRQRHRSMSAAYVDQLGICEKSYAARRPAMRAALILDIARNNFVALRVRGSRMARRSALNRWNSKTKYSATPGPCCPHRGSCEAFRSGVSRHPCRK